MYKSRIFICKGAVSVSRTDGTNLSFNSFGFSKKVSLKFIYKRQKKIQELYNTPVNLSMSLGGS
jgi:hypothetical protein